MRRLLPRAEVLLTTSLQSQVRRGDSALQSLVNRRKRSRRFTDLVRMNPALNRPLSKSYVKEIHAFWKRHYGRKVNPRWHQICTNVIGKEDVRYIPEEEWRTGILPAFNDQAMHLAYSDKNLYDRLVADETAPRAILKCVKRNYYGGDNRPVPRQEAFERILSENEDCIIKPSRTDDGRQIGRIHVRDGRAWIGEESLGIAEIEKRYRDNFIVQSLIVQHPAMAAVHPDSVNTLRLLSFRWKDEIRVLLAFARFGNNGSVNDNIGTGGLCCGVDESGRLCEKAIDAYCRTYETHPSTGYSFADRMLIPNYDAIKRRVVELHERILYFDLASWDIAIGREGQPVFVEVNFRGVSYLYQCASRRPIFGDLTAEVLEEVKRRRDRPN